MGIGKGCKKNKATEAALLGNLTSQLFVYVTTMLLSTSFIYVTTILSSNASALMIVMLLFERNQVLYFATDVNVSTRYLESIILNTPYSVLFHCMEPFTHHRYLLHSSIPHITAHSLRLISKLVLFRIHDMVSFDSSSLVSVYWFLPFHYIIRLPNLSKKEAFYLLFYL